MRPAGAPWLHSLNFSCLVHFPLALPKPAGKLSGSDVGGQVGMRRRVGLVVTIAFAAAVSGAMAIPSLADGFIREIKAGALAHDVDGLWSGFSRETETVE